MQVSAKHKPHILLWYIQWRQRADSLRYSIVSASRARAKIDLQDNNNDPCSFACRQIYTWTITITPLICVLLSIIESRNIAHEYLPYWFVPTGPRHQNEPL